MAVTDDIIDDTETVSFVVVDIDRVRGRGDLVGMAIVDMTISGVVIRLQGVQVRRTGASDLTISMPTFKSTRDARQRAAFVLPDELAQAIGASVADAWNNQALPIMATADMHTATALSTR